MSSPEDGQGAEELPLDWTQLGQQHDELPVRFPSDVTEISPDELDICIVGTAGQKITFIGSDFSNTVNKTLTSLILRSHLIHTMEGLQHFQCLDLLELYDNQISELACLADGEEGKPGITLRVLDMSYNAIREMDPVSFCPNLQELCKCIVSRLSPLFFAFFLTRKVVLTKTWPITN